MSDLVNQPGGPDDESFERMLAKHDDPTPEVRDARQEVAEARAELAAALDQLTDATQSALDVPGKIRRNPAKTAALVGGTGFLLAGGPRRVIRFVDGRLADDRHNGEAG